MSKRQLPIVQNFEARSGITFDLPQSARDKWIRAEAKSADATISIFDVIGEFEHGGVTVKRISSALRAIGDRDVVVNINSPGGDLFEGIAIYNLLREHPANVTVRVIGLAASAASIVAMAGDRIEMGAAAFMMIHNAWVVAVGNRHDLREVSTYLEPFDSALAEVYAARTGTPKTTVQEMMDFETWFSGKQAVELGFADSVLPADDATTNKETNNLMQKLMRGPNNSGFNSNPGAGHAQPKHSTGAEIYARRRQNIEDQRHPDEAMNRAQPANEDIFARRARQVRAQRTGAARETEGGARIFSDEYAKNIFASRARGRPGSAQ